ncbi:MAG: hypothetical protein VR64_22480 [Desulfatitalea sp. BRH_c12]|nr:MAG: hypothetical protein VR64_22480 [Desulfatitalea sp. BRH_c12]
MPAPNQKPDVFYLGFNKDTGELVEVVAPSGKNVTLDPGQIHDLSQGRLDNDMKRSVKEQLKDFKLMIRDNALPSTTLTFFDNPNHSVCGGSIGGIPFRFC